MLISLTGFSQLAVTKHEDPITVGKAKQGGNLFAEIYYYPETDTTFTFRYKDCRYTSLSEYKTVKFEGNQTLNDFYKILKDAFVTDDYKVDVKLGNDNLVVSIQKTMGLKAVSIMVLGKGYVNLTEKQVDKLFGKK